jgi:predicted transcriptional regulator of viral defense system
MPKVLDIGVRRDVLRLFKERNGWLRQPDLVAAGYHPRWLTRLTADKVIMRVRRGLYRIAHPLVHTHQSLVDACHVVPDGVICLLSALTYHDLTRVNAPEVYMAIGKKTWPPRVAYPPIRFFRFTDRQLHHGVEETTVNHGVHRLVRGRREDHYVRGAIRIFDPEKSICDCLRHRHVVGQDTVVAALRMYLQREGRNIERLVATSRVCRVEKRLRPYLEALL